MSRKTRIPKNKYATFSDKIPKGNDTSNEEFRDDIPSVGGNIYDLDIPGIYTDVAKPTGTIMRFRGNFRAFASITINGQYVRPSGIYPYFVRHSIKHIGQGNNTNYVVINSPNIDGDNQAGIGTTNLTENLT